MPFAFDDDSASEAVGRTGEARLQVTDDDLARAVGSGDLPVLATPRMIALMEEAACVAVNGLLPSDVATVGIDVDIRHRAPTPIGAHVTATARIDAVSGSRITFTVTAVHDRGGRETVIGEGTHVRAVVERAVFLDALRTD